MQETQFSGPTVAIVKNAVRNFIHDPKIRFISSRYLINYQGGPFPKCRAYVRYDVHQSTADRVRR